MAIWTTIRSRCKSFTNRAVAYHKLDDGETKEIDRPRWESVSLSESTAISQRQVQSAKSLLVVLLFTSAVFFAICLIFRALMRDYASIDMACTKQLSAWAPMMEAVDYQWTQYDSDRLPADYAGPPTLTRETNWLNQYDHGFIPYPYDQIAKLNKSTNRDWWVQDGNLVTLTEWAHQVHCLGLIRQWIYRDQFDYSMFTNTSSTRFHIHKDHCFMILKTLIECQADVTPVLLARDSSGIGAWKTRDAPRKCRRNDALVSFIEENKLCGLECNPEDITQTV